MRARLSLQSEIPAEALEGDRVPPYYRPPVDSPAFQYLQERRKLLNGAVPTRVVRTRKPMTLPGPEPFADIYAGSAKVDASTTTAFTRLLRNLSRVEGFGEPP